MYSAVYSRTVDGFYSLDGKWIDYRVIAESFKMANDNPDINVFFVIKTLMRHGDDEKIAREWLNQYYSGCDICVVRSYHFDIGNDECVIKTHGDYTLERKQSEDWLGKTYVNKGGDAIWQTT